MGEGLEMGNSWSQSSLIATHRQPSMNANHRTLMPLTTDMIRSLSTMVRIPARRAELQGVEVSESTFEEWLKAGGDRRAAPREISSRGGLTFTARRS